MARKKPKRRQHDLSLAKVRSAITNGTHVLRNVDHRIEPMRRLRDLIGGHVNQLGGEDSISHAERVLIGRASMLALLAEMSEQKFVRQRMKVTALEADAYCRTINTLRRVCESLGLQRRAKDITPSLESYLAEKYPSNGAGADAAAGD